MSQRHIRHEMLAETIANIHQPHELAMGRRIHAEFVRGLGIQAGRDQVGLVMQRTGIREIAGTRKRYVDSRTPDHYRRSGGCPYA